MKVYVVSAFSMNGSGGNKAGVVLDDFAFSANAKIALAASLGYSETVFLSDSGKADFKLEYFTPKGEVPLCGHATIASFIVLRDLGRLKKSKHTIETAAGLLRVWIDGDGLVFMEQNNPSFFEIIPNERLTSCFHPLSLDERFPARIVSTGLRDIIIPISTSNALEIMVPDFKAISILSKEMKCIGIHCFALTESDIDNTTTAICRNFAPLYGINEEAATGTSNCALACYLHNLGIRPQRYIFEQGHNLSSVSIIIVELKTDTNILGVRVGGDGVIEGMLDKNTSIWE